MGTSHNADELEAKLAAVKKEVESFIYVISHDLRSPLVSLQGFIDLLVEENNAVFSEDSKHYVDRINFNLSFMNKLLQDMLELSRISSNLAEKITISFETLFTEALNEKKELLEEKNIVVTLDVEPGIAIFAHKKQIAKLIDKLLDNAITFMGDSDRREIVLSASSVESDKVRIGVKDTGIGISTHHHRKIFEVFERIDASRSKLEGTGIGLFIVKKLVEENDGRVWVESELGKGALFLIELPKE